MIFELEAVIIREREFNASSQRINVEYLVNVLKNFLLADDLSERSQLVGVICQLLHLKPEESQLIGAKWINGGVAKKSGWLGFGILPTPNGFASPNSKHVVNISTTMKPERINRFDS